MNHLDNLGEEHEIDGVRFRISKLGYKAGKSLFVRVMKVLGPALADMADRAPSLAAMGVQLQGLDPASLGVLIDKVTVQELDQWDEILGKVSRYSTDGQNFPELNAGARELLFSGRQFFALKWLRKALEVQFGDFLSELAPPAESDSSPAEETQSASPSQS